MKNYFLLITYLLAFSWNAHSSNLSFFQEADTISVPNQTLREIIHTPKIDNVLAVCGLQPGEQYVILVSPANEKNCQPILRMDHLQVSNTANPALTFVATSECEFINMNKACKGETETWFYLNVTQPYSAFSSSKDETRNFMGITIQPNGTTNLVEDVFVKGDCVDISNITYSGNNRAIGAFSNGMSSIGIEEGIILASGDAFSAEGPNTDTGTTTNFGDNSGDGDLAQIAGVSNAQVWDAAILEFDFVPTSDIVTFDYVFASEEYCDYVGAPFNDMFGFFISGPGINGGYGNGADNIARLPSNNSNVSINSVNHLNNTQFYVHNVGPTVTQFPPCNNPPPPSAFSGLIEYDGYTVKLTAVAEVEPCQTYHMKLAVADAVDDWFDSAVFLAANSFDAATVATVEAVIPSGDMATEGCSEAQFVFTRRGGINDGDVIITFEVSGASTATEGEDFAPLPGTVTIPNGLLQGIVPVEVFADGILEGTETIIIEINSVICGNLCQAIEIAELQIEDGNPLIIDFEPPPSCQEGPVSLAPNVSGGIGDYTFMWSDGSSGTSLNVDATTTPTPYSVTITDECGQEEILEVEILAGGASASIDGSAEVCFEPASEEFLVTFTGTGPWTLEYSIDGTPQPPITNITENPYTLLAEQIGEYELINVSSNGCDGETNGIASLTLAEISIALNPQDVSCSGEADGSIGVDIFGGAEPYQFAWDNGETEQNLENLPSGTYTVFVTDANGCTAEEFITLEEPPTLEIVPLVVSEPDCDNPMGGSIELSVTGGPNGTYIYSWDNGASSQNIQDLEGGIFNVTVTDGNCMEIATVEVPDGGEPPIAIATAESDLDCNNTEVPISGDGSSDGIYLWTTDDGNIVNGENTLNPTVDMPGTYTLTVDNNGCIATAEVTIGGSAEPPIADAGFDGEITCFEEAGITLDGNGSSIGSEFIYQWTAGPGNIVDGENTLNPLVDEAGTYTLTVTNTINGCEEMSTVQVIENNLPPEIIIEIPDALGCETTVVDIDASSSSSNGNFTYEWTTNDGIIDNGDNTLNPSVSGEGTYTLTITNGDNGCTATQDVTIAGNTSEPEAIIETAGEITCTETEVILDGSNSIGENLTFSWSTAGGSILDGEDTPNPTVNGEGIYTLLITDSATGCTSEATVDVFANGELPTAVILDADMLTCDFESLILDASTSFTASGGDFTFQWSDNVDDPLTLTPEITVADTYTITITDSENGCEAITSITIDENNTEPDLTVDDASLTCGETSVSVEAFTSAADPLFEWMDENGDIVSNDAILDATEGGIYTVSVIDQENGCTNTTTVNVAENAELPEVIIVEPEMLTCIASEILIDASASSSDGDFSYSWTASGSGFIESGENTLNPTVSGEGVYELTIINNVNGCESTGTVEVFINNTPPEVEAGEADQLSCVSTQVILDGTGSATGDNISYNWTSNGGLIVSGENTLTPTVEGEGTYILEVIDNETGCSDIDEVIVTANEDLPDAIIVDAEDITCNIASIILDGTPSSSGSGFSFLWEAQDGGLIDEDETTLTPTISTAGTYVLTVTNDANGCTATTSITIFENMDEPEVNAENALLTCGETNVSVEATTSAADPLFEWTDQNGDVVSNDAILDASQGGTYTVMVTDLFNGCTNTTTIEVLENSDVPSIIIADPEMLTCTIEEIIIDASDSSSDGDFSYSWTASGDGIIESGDNTLTPTVSGAGIYELTVFNNATNCESTATVEVFINNTLPEVEAGEADQISCISTQVVLDGTGSATGDNISYIWTSNGGLVVSGENTLTPTVEGEGTYILEVIDNETGCSDIDEVIVTANEDLPDAIIVDAEDLTCEIASIVLDGTPSSSGSGFSFLWEAQDGGLIDADETTLTPTISSTGTYVLTVTNDANGCTATTSISIDENIEEPDISVDDTYTLTCEDNSLTISVSTSIANPAFEWSDEQGNVIAGETNSSLEVTGSGDYTVVVTNLDNGCNSSETINVAEDANVPEVIIAEPDILNCAAASLVLDASASTTANGGNADNFSYTWTASNGGIIDMDENTATPTVSASGTYELMITNLQNNCSNTAAVVVSINDTPPAVEAGAAQQLSCTTTQVVLDGTGSATGDNISYNWTSNGGFIVSGGNTLMPTVEGVGTYTLEVIDNETGCSATDEVIVDSNEDLPDAIIADANDLTCEIASIILDGTASSSGSGFSFLWEVQNGGVIDADETTLTPTISSTGTYVLTVTNDANGCTATTSIIIDENTQTPDISIDDTYTLDCGANSLSISVSSSIANPAFQWSDAQGNVLTGETNASLEVMQSGSYTVEITNMDNGCTNSIAVPVGEDANAPEVIIANPDMLTCGTSTLVLDASASSNGDNFSYNWTATNGGVIDEGATTLTPTISATGTYELTILDNTNSCSNASSVVVEINDTPPTAEAGMSQQLSCTSTEVVLNGTGSSEGTGITYNWTTDGGSIVSGGNTLTPTVSGVGTYTLEVMDSVNGCSSTDDVLVDSNEELPDAIIANSETLTCNVTTLVLDGTASSSGAGFSFEWDTQNGGVISADANTLTPTISAPGTYLLQITDDGNGCIANTSIVIEEDTEMPDISVDDAYILTCEDNSLTISVSTSIANPAFVWMTEQGTIIDGETNSSLEITAAGEYTAVITNLDNGCENNLVVPVAQDANLPEVNIANPDMITCTNEAVTLNSSTSATNVSLSWTATNGGTIQEGETTLSPIVTSAGTYTLEVMDNENGCTSTAFIEVLEDTTPPVAEAGIGATLDCSITSLTLDGSTDNPDANLQISWTSPDGNIVSGQNTFTPTVNAAGTYTLNIINQDNGCSATDNVVIDLDPSVPEVLIATPDMLTCDVTILTLDASNTTSDMELAFNWSTTNGNIVSGADTPLPVIDAPGNYQLTILIGENCSNTAAIEVSEDIAPPIANAGQDFTISCVEPETFLNGAGSSEGTQYSYTWSTDDGLILNNNQTLEPAISGGGTYTLTVENNQNGCINTDAIFVEDDAPDGLNLLVVDPNCNTSLGSIEIFGVSGGTAPYQYSIDGGSSFDNELIFNNLDSGTYDIVVQDANGCTHEESHEIDSLVEPEVTLTEDVQIDAGQSHNITATPNIPAAEIASIEWSPAEGLNCADCLTVTATPEESTLYEITIIDENGCIATANIHIFINKKIPIYIPNAFSPGDDGMNNVFTIFTEPNKIKQINSLQIFDRWGELVFENYDFQPNDLSMGWDGSHRGELLNPAVFIYWTEIELLDEQVVQMKGDVTLTK